MTAAIQALVILLLIYLIGSYIDRYAGKRWMIGGLLPAILLPHRRVIVCWLWRGVGVGW